MAIKNYHEARRFDDPSLDTPREDDKTLKERYEWQEEYTRQRATALSRKREVEDQVVQEEHAKYVLHQAITNNNVN